MIYVNNILLKQRGICCGESQFDHTGKIHNVHKIFKSILFMFVLYLYIAQKMGTCSVSVMILRDSHKAPICVTAYNVNLCKHWTSWIMTFSPDCWADICFRIQHGYLYGKWVDQIIVYDHVNTHFILTLLHMQTIMSRNSARNSQNR